MPNPESKIKQTKKEPLSREALDLVAARFRVLGDATRLNLLQLLMTGEKSVQELCLQTGMSQANVSKHLSILADQGMISRRKQSLFVYYTISDNSIYQLCDLVCSALATRFEEIQRHLK